MSRFYQFLAVIGFSLVIINVVIVPVIAEAVGQFHRTAAALESAGHRSAR